MFRIYPNKDALFEAAVLAPFEQFMESFSLRWLSADVPGGDPQVVLTQFVAELHDLVAENRALITALATSDQLTTLSARAIGRLEEVGEAISKTYQIEFDVPVAVRIATIAVAATAMLEQSFFPAAQRGDRLVAELTRMLVGATLYQPPPAD